MKDWINKKEIKFILSNVYPFNKLRDRDLDNFLLIAEIRDYRNGEIIYKEGDPPDYFNLLIKGRVLALTKQADRDSEIELLKRGTSFGIISLFNDEAHSVTSKSIENSVILRVKKERFKDFLKKHPAISLDFSRLLSERVRGRFQPKKIFQSKRVSIVGNRSSGKTTYMYSLGLKIKEQTKKNLICLEFSTRGDFSLPSFIRKEVKVLKLSEFREENIKGFIIDDAIDFLLVRIDERANLVSLLNFLSENYHFVLYEIPFDIKDSYILEFVSLAHYIHFVFPPIREELERYAFLIDNLKKKNASNNDKIKVIINEFIPSDGSTLEAKSDIVNCPIYATLPKYSEENYFKVLRRIARELGEVTTGVALGSGAAYGFAHVGVLKILEKNNIPIDIICGSSTGAFIAAMWALGYKIEEIEKTVISVAKKFSLFSLPGIAFPFKGLLRAKKLENVFRKIFQDKTFFDLKHSLKIVTFDFIKREPRILEEGSLYKAVAASCAMPGVFEPVNFKAEILLDGGILKPLPSNILVSYGAKKIIAVNITPTKEEIHREYKKRDKLHILDFIFGSIETMQREFIDEAMKISDVVIHPDFEGIGWMEFEKVEDFIKRGEKAALEKLEEIKKLITS